MCLIAFSTSEHGNPQIQIEQHHLQNAGFELQLQANFGACTCNISRDAGLKRGKWSSEISLEPRRKAGVERKHTTGALCENRRRKEGSLRGICLGKGCPVVFDSKPLPPQCILALRTPEP